MSHTHGIVRTHLYLICLLDCGGKWVLMGITRVHRVSHTHRAVRACVYFIEMLDVGWEKRMSRDNEL